MTVSSGQTFDLSVGEYVDRLLYHLCKNACTQAFPGDSEVKNSPAVQETRIQSLGLEDPLEKEMATYSSILAWEIS